MVYIELPLFKYFFNMQGAYSGYGSTYANPQVPTTVPQTAVYGSYSQTYPVQVLNRGVDAYFS